MSDAIPGLNQPPTAHSGLISWVNEIAALTRPARVQWCDGSQQEWDELTSLLVEQGTLLPLNPDLRPGSFLARCPVHLMSRLGLMLRLLRQARNGGPIGRAAGVGRPRRTGGTGRVGHRGQGRGPACRHAGHSGQSLGRLARSPVPARSPVLSRSPVLARHVLVAACGSGRDPTDRRTGR